MQFVTYFKVFVTKTTVVSVGEDVSFSRVFFLGNLSGDDCTNHCVSKVNFASQAAEFCLKFNSLLLEMYSVGCGVADKQRGQL